VVNQILEAGFIPGLGEALPQGIHLPEDRRDVFPGGPVGRDQTRDRPVVLGDGDFLALGDTLKELGKVRFGVKRADNGA
jgi:hypothetical protein